MWTIPNILTLARLALLLPMVCLFFMPYASVAWVCFTLYVIGAVTDGLDGWIARKYNQTSAFGAFLDPISDKIYVVTIMLMLVATQRISGVFVVLPILILTREFLVSGLREYLGPKNVKVPVTPLAKWKTAAQMIAVGVLIVAPFVAYAGVIGLLLLTIATALTLWTGWQYLQAGFVHMID